MEESRNATDASSQEALERQEASRANVTAQREYDEVIWMAYAFAAGVVGAFIVAVLFLIVDLITGRGALWTPAYLGAALFRGEAIAADADPTTMLPLVAGYTVLHGVVFFGFAALVGSARLAPRPAKALTTRSAIIVTILLFVGLEIMFAALGWVVGADLNPASRLGFGWVTVANLLASLGMTAVIGWGAKQLASRAARPEQGSR
jgi:hypothetical protein